jgi:fatty-acid peroxygenase
MSAIPHDPLPDATVAMLRDGYEFISKRCARFESDLFQTRVMGKRTVCIHGREAAELFYDDTKMQRHGAVPRRVVTSLFGKRAVHTLDDAEHRARKSAFLLLMTPENVERLMTETALQWRHAIRRWEGTGSVVLFEEVQQLLTAATCTWAGVPLEASAVSQRARDFGAMVDAFGGVGPRLWQGKLARIRTQRWLTRVIKDARKGILVADPKSALGVMAQHCDVNGRRLPAKLAAIELINVIRPTVAIAWYVAFAAHALQAHPEWRDLLRADDQADRAAERIDMFMQELRRFYPFTPYLGAKVRVAFDWRGHRFKPNTLVLLDVYGTDHDPRLWHAANEFRPERFERGHEDAYDFIPQGGGSRLGHRCPGEWITMHNVALALHFLTRCMTYEVPVDQDLRFDLSRMPTRPRSGVVLRNVRATSALDAPAPKMPSCTATHESAAAVRAGELCMHATRGVA